MRLVKKDLADKPAILSHADTVAALHRIHQQGNGASISEKYYQDPYHEEGKRQMRVRDKLNEFYLHKCAYCETLCKAEIEHYRPKKAVKDPQANNGYYWLCYEWSNLIPSCHDCNTSGGKGNQFPVKGTRLLTPSMLPDGTLDLSKSVAGQSPLIDEQPYLLHPELDEPDGYLGVQLDPKGEGIQLKGIDGLNQRGDQTIAICNLNRIDLQMKRLTTLKSFIKEINTVFLMYMKGLLLPEHFSRELFDVFRRMDVAKVSPKKEHTLLRQYVMATEKQFAAVVIPCLKSNQQQLIMMAFSAYWNQR